MVDFDAMLAETTLSGHLGIFNLCYKGSEFSPCSLEVINSDAVFGWLSEEADFGLLKWYGNTVLGVLPPSRFTAKPPVVLANLGKINIWR